LPAVHHGHAILAANTWAEVLLSVTADGGPAGACAWLQSRGLPFDGPDGGPEWRADVSRRADLTEAGQLVGLIRGARG
jgi:hypothetical protein